MQRYRARISGPLLDRIDIHVEVPTVSHDKLQEEPAGEPSRVLREAVDAARQRQLERQGCLNKDLAVQAMDRHCALAPAARNLLHRAMDRLGLSARAYHRVIRLARTVADLAGEDAISETHIGEAIQLRCLDRPV